MSRRANKKRAVRKLETIWEVPDELWVRMEEIMLERHPQARTGRPRSNWRQIINGIIYQLRTGCQWNHLPKIYGSDSTVHRWLTTWCESGVIEAIWSELAAECDELDEVHWKWQSVDGAMGKARMGGEKIGKNPTDRAKMGVKKSLLVDQEGGPLGAVIAGANVHDTKLLEQTLESVVIERPEPDPAEPEHLCLDRGYQNPTGQNAAAQAGYVPHIRPMPETARAKKTA